MYTSSDRAPRKNAAWLTSDEKIKHAVVVRDEIDDEDQSDESWTAFSQTLGDLLDFVVTSQRVCCPHLSRWLLMIPTGFQKQNYFEYSHLWSHWSKHCTCSTLCILTPQVSGLSNILIKPANSSISYRCVFVAGKCQEGSRDVPSGSPNYRHKLVYETGFGVTSACDGRKEVEETKWQSAGISIAVVCVLTDVLIM